MTICLPILYASSGDDGNLSGDLTAIFSLCYFLCLELASASLHLTNLYSSRKPSQPTLALACGRLALFQRVHIAPCLSPI